MHFPVAEYFHYRTFSLICMFYMEAKRNRRLLIKTLLDQYLNKDCILTNLIHASECSFVIYFPGQ